MDRRQGNVSRYAGMLSAMGTEPRLRIVRLLLAYYPQGMAAGRIHRRLGIPGTTLSHHLEKLRNQDLVTVRREGTHLWYSVNRESLQELLSFLYSECCSRSKVVDLESIMPNPHHD